MIRRFAFAAVLLASLGLAAQDSRSASVTLQAAIAAEQIDQDLPKAIGLYERAVKEAGSDRMLAAQILLRLGQAQAKAGRAQDARATFERILREHSDSGQPAAIAKSRLATPAAGGFQEVPADPNADRDRWLSPDGKQVIVSDGGRLIHRNLESGKDVVLAGGDQGRVLQLVWAPDSRRFAFLLLTTAGKGEIRSANILTKQIAVVVRAETEPDQLLGWTTTDVLFVRTRPTNPGSADWWLAPIDGAAPQKVFTASAEAGVLGKITPDGSSIIVIKDQHLWLFELKAGTYHALTTGSGTERGPVLSPDGRFIGFLSNRDGQWRLYVAPMNEVPILKAAPVATIDDSSLSGGTPGPMYWINGQGVITLRANRIESNIYRANRVASGFEFTALERLTQDFRQSDGPSVSPDGLRVAYRYRTGAATGIGLMDANGRAERALLAERPSREAGPLAWQSAAAVLFYRPARDGESAGIRSVDTGTGTVTAVPHGDVEAATWAYARESRQIFFVPRVIGPPLPVGRRALKARSLADGSERTIADIDGLFEFVMCEGAKSIVYTRVLGASATTIGPTELRQMSLDGTNDRLLQAAQNVNRNGLGLIPASCSTDGRFLLYFSNRPHVLNLETGQDSLLPNIADIDWNEQGALSRDGSFVLVSGSMIITEKRSWSGVTDDAVKRLGRY